MQQIVPTGAALAILLTGCASSPEPVASAPAVSPSAAEPAFDPAIWEKAGNGALVHRKSGGVCPMAVSGQKRFDTLSFSPDGRDVACQYETEDGQSILTLYFTDFGDLTAQSHVDQAVQAVTQAKGMETNEAASLKCQSELGLVDGMQAPAQGSEGTKVIAARPCVMFSGAGRSSLLTVRSYDNWHFKIRLTSPDTGEKGERAAIGTASDLLAIQNQAMGGRTAGLGAGREA